jgi:hypothetical protein
MYFFDTGLACYLTGIRDAEALKHSFLKGRLSRKKEDSSTSSTNLIGTPMTVSRYFIAATPLKTK